MKFPVAKAEFSVVPLCARAVLNMLRGNLVGGYRQSVSKLAGWEIGMSCNTGLVALVQRFVCRGEEQRSSHSELSIAHLHRARGTGTVSIMGTSLFSVGFIILIFT